MSLSTEKKKEIINKFGKNKDDSGSTETQVALLTQRTFQAWISETGFPAEKTDEIPAKNQS